MNEFLYATGPVLGILAFAVTVFGVAARRVARKLTVLLSGVLDDPRYRGVDGTPREIPPGSSLHTNVGNRRGVRAQPTDRPANPHPNSEHSWGAKTLPTGSAD